MSINVGDEVLIFDKRGINQGNALVTFVNRYKKRIHFIRPDGSVGAVREKLAVKTGQRYKLDAELIAPKLST